ncbi:hypothetical protein ACIQ7D_29130 [Streptomyces sp. NPDC096310]|uniref:hypothetical protein n=1 Tax=Streptomyces sp. NPDC096310 TaxID=3366082 RepID=UPI00382FC5BB
MPPNPPRVPSPLRNRAQWTAVVFAVIAALIPAMVLGGWDWIWTKINGPSGITVYADRPYSCPRYIDMPKADVRKDVDAAYAQGVRVSDKSGFPAELSLTLQAKTSQAVVVTGVKVKVLSNRAVPSSGFVVYGECGGGMTPRRFDVSLAKTPVPVRPAAPAKGDEVVDFPFKVADSDPEQLTLQLRPGERDIRFTVEVEWVADGEHGSKILDNAGQGFRVMGTGDLPTYGYGEMFQ